ncbi:MAG: enoyl-CoA hydratase/isomerase family protein [Deltaproteobacteria bacterium]|nr:enoyl-CoA hydratase/isomerase family protein [Deltaproteobacteria bacterium]
MAESVLLSKEGDIAVVTLNRPEVFNAFDHEMVQRLADCLTDIAADAGIRGVVITGAGKAFCAGGDLKSASKFPGGPPAAFYKLASIFHKGIVEIFRMRRPVIAAVNGIAAGAGFSLALACDFRVMEKSASFRQAYTSWGLCIDGGGTYTLPRLVGSARAIEIAAFDAPISSVQAIQWGLVTKVTDDGRSLEKALNIARELEKRSLNSFAVSKRLILESFCAPVEVHLEKEREGISACAAHPDGIEGLAAFNEKRSPEFKRDSPL